ncbi:TrmH family RNA methyltransferase [Mesomycoplasma lagogenitalium]|uniref:RNA methyltransferase n=1 Tax=Mesomycoplasma lagogenitalium TaxID=171286 RepID=A0ABY8LSL9_9BACT|nr:RNA methyltransferase [Mesomycoplasma lagogenitalium]WGI36261.1 RNA methyltransferase [Mesomycoplasma lagogenitalium]
MKFKKGKILLKMIISSLQNPKIKEYSKLLLKKYRDKFNLFIIENWKNIQEALKKNLVVEILTSDINFKIDKSINVIYVEQHIIDKLSNTKNPQNIIAICKKMTYNFELGKKVVVLDNIQDPGNLGTIIRNAVAFGFNSVIIKGVDLYNEKVLRAAQGAIFHINIIQENELKQFLEKIKNQYYIFGTLVDHQSKDIGEIKNLKDQKMIIIFGNEGNGISKELNYLIDQNIFIKINFESLNVASASAIILNYFKEIKNDR